MLYDSYYQNTIKIELDCDNLVMRKVFFGDRGLCVFQSSLQKELPNAKV